MENQAKILNTISNFRKIAKEADCPEERSLAISVAKSLLTQAKRVRAK